ncbi:MAG TPA: hypothetical protein VFV87_21230 [Pirellulaceae bacterium]|nr:hypothetical protein [Pirellulaceae bacterium]
MIRYIFHPLMWLAVIAISTGIAGVAESESPDIAAAPLSGRLFFMTEGRIGSLGANDENPRFHSPEWKPGNPDLLPYWLRVSPDGGQIAFGIVGDQGPGVSLIEATGLYLRGRDATKPAVDTKRLAARWCWSPNGKQLAGSSIERPRGVPEAQHWIMEVPTLTVTSVNLPSDRLITDWSADGNWFLTESAPFVEPRRNSIQLVKRGGTEVRTLSDPKEHAIAARFSPSGRGVLLTTFDFRDRKSNLYVVQIGDDITRRKVSADFFGQVVGACWSPDNKQIASVWRMKYIDPVKEAKAAYSLVVTDADGGNAVAIRTVTGQMPAEETAAHPLSWVTMSALDWQR